MTSIQTATVPVLCLPFAGGAASFFRAWRPDPEAGITLWPLQLPGREERLDEDPCQSVAASVADLAAGLLDQLSPGAEVALFGHSLGAVLAFELARTLADWPGVTVRRLFVSGSPGPDAGRAGRASGLDDDAFLQRVQEFAGYRHPGFDIPELRELILPVLRADVLSHENYRPSAPGPIPVPITSLRGVGDELVSEMDSLGWARATSAAFEYVKMPGGHMYLTEGPDDVMAIMADRIACREEAGP